MAFERHMYLFSQESGGTHCQKSWLLYRAPATLQGERLFAFERYMVFRKSGGNHCQVNALAVPAAAAEGAADALTRAAEAAGFALMPLKGPHEVRLSNLFQCDPPQSRLCWARGLIGCLPGIAEPQDGMALASPCGAALALMCLMTLWQSQSTW